MSDARESNMAQDFEIEIRQRKQKYFLGSAHSHNHYELYYLQEGEIKYFIGDNIFLVKKGDVVLIPPHIIHKTVPCDDYCHTRILMNFTADFVREYLAYNPRLLDFFKQPVVNMQKRKMGRVESILDSMLYEYANTGDIIMIKSLMGELLSLLNRAANADAQEGGAPCGDGLSRRILEIVRFINVHYPNEINLETLSAKFYMSPTYLSRSFKKVMGITYSEYIKSVRINHSVHLLLNTPLNVTQIAMKTGFNSSNHFCKIFKDSMSISPLKYRKNYNKLNSRTVS